MEDGLVLVYLTPNFLQVYVLILVVMEDGLVPTIDELENLAPTVS